MTIRGELLDELLKEYHTSQDILGEGGLLKELTKAVIERCLETELDTHLGYPKHARKGNSAGNVRNGQSQKTLKGEQGHVEIEVPRDRQGSFEPQLVKKGQTRLDGFDDKILALYARGMTTRDIQAQLQELSGVEVSPALISNVTEAVMEEVRQWQTRPLEPLYPIVYVDCLVVVTSLITYPAFHHKLSTPRSLLELCAGTSFPHHLSMRQTWSRKVTMRIPRASKTGPSDLFLDVPAFL